MSTSEFAGQVALVTGATRGIGAAIAQELAARGLKVIGTATSDEGAARISAERSSGSDNGPTLHAFVLDGENITGALEKKESGAL